MKLLPLEIASHPKFRERLTSKLQTAILRMQLKDEEGWSVDGVARIGGVEFLTVPHILTTHDTGDDEAKIVGSIRAELNLQIYVPGVDGDDLKTEDESFRCDFVVFVYVSPKLRDRTPEDYIGSFKFSISELNLTKGA